MFPSARAAAGDKSIRAARKGCHRSIPEALKPVGRGQPFCGVGERKEKKRPGPRGPGRFVCAARGGAQAVSEVVGQAAIVIATIRVESRSERTGHDLALPAGTTCAGTEFINFPWIAIGPNIEEIVAADRELQRFGDVIPNFRVGETNTRLVEGIEHADSGMLQ